MLNKIKTNKSVTIELKDTNLKGNLTIPENAIGLVIFSHGSGSSRLSPRNNFVSVLLQQKGLATLLFDLLTEEEDRDYENRFNIELLTTRLVQVTLWVGQQKETRNLPTGYFGASTGAASALRAAAFLGPKIAAVVSRGGRPDMAIQDLSKVMAPTLLIVGGRDEAVIGKNEKAFEKLTCERKLEIIPQATHLFEETGKLQEVALLTTNWFAKYLVPQKMKHSV
ncbi:dienelactone hydrolase family protein [Maribacter luteus]|uniref:Alpha/beta hydrolase n=1 Tax=Maribacter luteus TaxID=2594478 RepID=A0A6I2MKC4_9FLAO|nr:dienelactone hydrolase family protein [Maribacter luteus]MRX63532.1 alpha/beta hydrolase [Maribacter luteus]